MAHLNPEERDLIGQWVRSNGGVVGDVTEDRIEELIASYLEKVATDWSGWETLYRDPQDGRFWELTYPTGEYHGGGPKRLTNISLEHARGKYGEGVEHPATEGTE
jgi:hypothetical protein